MGFWILVALPDPRAPAEELLLMLAYCFVCFLVLLSCIFGVIFCRLLIPAVINIMAAESFESELM